MIENNKQVVCVSDGEGDYWDITEGKIYTILKENPEYLLYTTIKEDGNVVKNTVPRVLIKNDANNECWYPPFCFKTLASSK